MNSPYTNIANDEGYRFGCIIIYHKLEGKNRNKQNTFFFKFLNEQGVVVVAVRTVVVIITMLGIWKLQGQLMLGL